MFGRGRRSFALQAAGCQRTSSHNAKVTNMLPGECVRRAVTRMEPRALVYQVEHCGWVCARRERASDGTWSWWRLDPGECHGVSWSV